MRYLITGYGTKKDIGTTEHYQELGAELMVTRLSYIRGLKTGKYTKDDVVVTINDRKFLYTKLTDNVISCEEFNDIRSKNPNIEVVDFDINKELEYLHVDYQLGLINNYKYIEDKPQILDIDYSNVEEKYNLGTEKFCGALIRIRQWASFRSLDDEFYSNIIDELTKRYNKVFVFGLGSEKIWQGKNVIYLNSLQDWTSIINHPLCDVIVSPASGAGAICQICSNSNMLLVSSDDQMCKRHPLYFSTGVNFRDVKITITPTIENVKNKLKEITGK